MDPASFRKYKAPNSCCSRGGNVPSFCLELSELEDVVLDKDWHFLFMATGAPQLSKYLSITKKNQKNNEPLCSLKQHQDGEPDFLSSPLKCRL